jgi:hypothetical protein
LTLAACHKCLAVAAGCCAALAHVCAIAQENLLERPTAHSALALIDGRWNGANLERRSNCSSAQNNGTRGTYAELVISVNSAGDIGITQNGITGLTCNYFGKYRFEGLDLGATGSYSCSDGKRGDFQARGILVTQTAVSIRMDIQLNTSETCTIDGILGGSRFPP